MRKFLIFLAAMMLAAAAFGGTVVSSKHDLRATGGGTPTGTGLTEVCVVCHTPHQTTGANRQFPLWNRSLSAQATYGVYGSSTFNGASTITDVGGAALGTATTTNLCLSCHDGTVSVLSMLNNPNSGTPTVTPIAGIIDANGKIISGANVGTDLRDDHPVNFTYDTALATADGGLKDPATNSTVAARLSSGKVQCTSCHEVHDPQYGSFLFTSNTGSAVCTTCHTK